MFKNIFLQNQARDLRTRKEPLSQERLQPDSSLFVPDGRMGLLLKNGEPDRWFQPGRHQLDSGHAKVEVRLISSGLIRGQRLDQASDLPFERAFLFADGRQVAIVIPGHPIGGRPQDAFDPAVHRRQEEPFMTDSVVRDEDDDPILDFSFV